MIRKIKDFFKKIDQKVDEKINKLEPFELFGGLFLFVLFFASVGIVKESADSTKFYKQVDKCIMTINADLKKRENPNYVPNVSKVLSCNSLIENLIQEKGIRNFEFKFRYLTPLSEVYIQSLIDEDLDSLYSSYKIN